MNDVISMDTLVLVNSTSPGYRQGVVYVLPYIDHFGIPYKLWDINQAPLPTFTGEFALVVIAHPEVDPTGHQLSQPRLLEAIKGGTGLATFDPGVGFKTRSKPRKPVETGSGTGISFIQSHNITSRHTVDETIPLAAPIHLSYLSGDKILLASGGNPLLAISNLGAGRIFQWASTDWMDTRFLGPLGGLDDVLWRSLVWAARKPFALRGLPPLVTMRVDDVAGTGHLWGQSPLGWVHTANRYGFKPWLGVFPYNLTEAAIAELRPLLLDHQATAFPHAFGRPPRGMNPMPEAGKSAEADSGSSRIYPASSSQQLASASVEVNPTPYYNPSFLPLRAVSYDEFIYYDHENQRPWSDSEASRGLAAVDAWYEAHAPLPISSYAIAHWGEMGSNTLAHVRDRWGCEFIATYHGVNAPLEGASWLVAGPFRKHEPPRSALFDRSNQGDRSMYYADFINFADRQFFLCCTEVRDETGYEWAPDGDVKTSAARGLRQLKRALDSFALPVLFTHETDYIYKISPQAWEAQLAIIADGISTYDPIYVTLDESIRYVRATKTSHLASAAYDPVTHQVTARFTGLADIPTHFHLFYDQSNITSTLVEVPSFADEIIVKHE